MANWKIQAIPLGANFIMKEAITVGLDVGLQIWFPYLVFFLTDGKRKILVDCGISENWIVDGKAWGGFPAYGGTEYALKEFEKAKIPIKFLLAGIVISMAYYLGVIYFFSHPDIVRQFKFGTPPGKLSTHG